jgi:Leucine-rich repeat (LRR) protein
LDISYNQIDDLTPIIELNKLEFVNAIGNNIPKEQITALKNNNIIVIS